MLRLPLTPPVSLSLSTPRTSHSLSSPFSLLPHSKRRILNQRGGRALTCKALAGAEFLSSFESFQSVAEAAAVLASIVFVHESGHFLAAVLQGIHVSKFAIGFGPPVAKFTSRNVEYSLRAFPLGGFVAFPDDDPASDIPQDDPNLLRNRPLLDRFLVISAGVVANILFAYTIVFFQVVTVGLLVQESLPGVRIPEVRVDSAAKRDGILPGDVVLSADGVSAPSVSDLVEIIKRNPSREVKFEVERSGKGKIVLNVVPDRSADGSGRIGVQLSPNFKTFKLRARDLGEAVRFSTKEVAALTFTVLEGLKQTFLNFAQTAEKVSGPVAIIAVGAEVARSNADGLFQFAAVINLNLAVINLLPLPALDGGSLALLLVEAVRGGRKIPKEVEQQIMTSGITVVLFLGLFLIVRDTLNLEFVKQLL